MGAQNSGFSCPARVAELATMPFYQVLSLLDYNEPKLTIQTFICKTTITFLVIQEDYNLFKFTWVKFIRIELHSYSKNYTNPFKKDKTLNQLSVKRIFIHSL